MKATMTVLFAVFFAWAGALATAFVLADYNYTKEIGGYWNLSEKASTIQQKSAYLDQFVAALEKASLADHNALFLKTPDNSLAQNMVALKSLQGRMHAILGMDVNSFAYQQAMAQITGQEQGEAKNMLDVLEGAWYLEHHFFLWGWIGIVHAVFVALAAIVFGFISTILWLD